MGYPTHTAVSAPGVGVQWALDAAAGAPGGAAGDVAFLPLAPLPFPSLRKKAGDCMSQVTSNS